MDAQSQHIKTRGLSQSLVPNPAIQFPATSDRSFQSPVFYYETLLSYGLATDPRVVLQALNGYILARQQPHGIALFRGVLDQYGATMNAQTRALYLSCLGVLRATFAEKVPLIKRIPWVKQSFDLLEQSLSLTGHENPISHWAAGMVYAQVPFFFGKKSAAVKHLKWLIERPETEPVYGFYREVYHALAKLSTGAAKDAYLAKAGYTDYQPSALMMGWFVNGPEGTAMAPSPVLDEIVPGRVFALFGFGFSDVYFVLSADKKQLIAVDAGTHPHTLQAAHEYLLRRHPGLPPITTAIITHAHWDHIGGINYLRRHNPELAIYGRDNFGAVVDRVLRDHSYHYFRGEKFDAAGVKSYAPTHPVKKPETITIGGTEIALIPVQGGETEDAMLIHMPELDTVFVGDMVMPWYGEPWVNEGFVTDVMGPIKTALGLGARHMLHGHHPLTFLYNPQNLQDFEPFHAWVVAATQTHITQGYSAKDIIRLNLVPPDLVDYPDLYLGFFAARDTIILRTADTMTGIWREDRTGQSPEGLDVITAQEHGRMFEKYLNLSARQTAKMLRRMIANGDHELALQSAVAAEQRYGATAAIIAAKEQAADALRSGIQYTDPFKFTTYSEMIARPQPALARGEVTS